jgi:Zn-dependent protease with chaperone function
MELRLPRRQLRELIELVEDVARQRGLQPPAEIRLGADTVAHVYEDRPGHAILVIGGVAVAAFPQQALAGIIAHELAHFTFGDTRISRRGSRRALAMALLEYKFSERRISYLNPLVWLTLLYHLFYRLAWAAHSRAREYAADQHEVQLVGKHVGAAALIHATVTEYLPWARLSAIIESCLATNQPLERVFAEQARLARETSKDDWQEACRKALKQKAGLFDSHPGLKDRLAAMGVSWRKALQLALDQSGPPARDLFADWDVIERELTERLVAPFREYYLAKMEVAQIILGRPVTRQ